MPEIANRFEIRDMRGDEREIVHTLTLTAYTEYAKKMQPTAWAGLHGAILAAFEIDTTADIIVATQTDSSELIGSVMLFPPALNVYGNLAESSKVPELRLLAVLPEARGWGVGKSLTEACIARASSWGATTLGLHTSDSMRTAMGLYEKLGFVRVPIHDFQPPGAELVKAFQLELNK
jgi:GNAT superfamily N-acetyltransferase